MFIRRFTNAQKAYRRGMRKNIGTGSLLIISCLAAINVPAQQWDLIGPDTGISTSWGSFQHLAKDNAGNLYVSFYDGSVTQGSVMKYNGTSWSYLGGTAGITGGTATYSALAVDTNNDIYYCNQVGWPGAGMDVRKFSNGSWTTLPQPVTTTVNYQAMTIGTNNRPYVSFASNGTPVVQRYDGMAWQTVGTGLPAGTPTYLDMKAGNNDSIYVCFVNSGLKVYKIHATATPTDTWEELGTTSFSATSSEQFRSSMAIDAANNIYIAFTSPSVSGNKINVKKYSAGQWSDVGATDFSDFRVHYVSITVNAAGTPYVAFSNFEDSPNNKNTVMKFNGTQWELVGIAGISEGEAKWNALIIDNTNAPVLSYSDGSISGGNMVKRFGTPTTNCTNTLPGTAIGSLGCVTFTYQGQPVTYPTVRAADGKVWLQQNLGAAGIATSKIDSLAYGDLFQWGRWDDGHQLRNAATGTVPSINNPSGITTNTNQFFIGTGTSAWWNDGQLSDTWTANIPSAVSTTDGADPCKAIGNDWHVPTQAEWNDVVTDEAITSPDLAFSSNLKLTVGGSRSSSDGDFDFVGTRGYYWSSTTSSTGGKYYYFSAAVNNPNAGNLRGGGASVRCINTTGTVNILDSIQVTTLNNVAAEIPTNNGTLQLIATLYPSNSNQDVTWSILPGTGAATIDLSGLVTAQTEGIVWAKAISVQDTTQSDSLLITISNPVIPPQDIDSIVVKTLGNVNPVINTLAGTLQMQAIIYPSTANQEVTWSILPATGIATISTSGLVSAQQDGSIWVKAVSVEDISQSDSLQVTITGQSETGINEMGTLRGFAIYPNPADQEVNIALKGSHPSLDILLTDVYGRSVNQQHIATSNQGSNTKIKLDKIVAGLYFITVKGPGIQLINRVVVR